MKKHSFFILCCFSILVGCISLPPYPSSWPKRAEVSKPSQLSGIYQQGLMRYLNNSMEGTLYPSWQADQRVQMLLNDSMQYEMTWVHVTTKDTGNHTLNKPYTMGSKYVKAKFHAGKGLELSFHPDVGGQGIPIGVLRNYIIIGKDEQGNLVIRNGQRVFGLVFLFIPVIAPRYEWISVGRDTIMYSSKRLEYLY